MLGRCGVVVLHGALAATALTMVSLFGCSNNVYEVEMRPRGDAIERDLTAWHDGPTSVGGDGTDGKPQTDFGELSPEELERIARAYGQGIAANAATKHRFTGTFRGVLPNDVGGAGSYTRWQSSLGDLYVYVERVRGSDDLAADLSERRAALDRAIDILIGWLDGELSDDPIAPKLHALLNGPMRRDADNLLLDAWSTAAAYRNQSLDGRDAVFHDLLFRSAQYLVERDYFAPDDLPHIVRALEEANGAKDNERLLAIVRATAARKLKLDDDTPLGGLMALLDDNARVERTFWAYVKTTPEFAEKVRESHIMATLGTPRREIEAEDVLSDLICRALLPRRELLSRPDQLRVKLRVAVAPTATNGQYDADTGTLNWIHTIDPAHARLLGLPRVLFAAWAEPSEVEQTRRFGKVVLRGEPLAKYVFWHRGLTDAEQVQWSRFLDSLQPGAELPRAVAAFRFPPDANKKETDDGDLAQTARGLLLDAIKKLGQE